MAIQPPNNGLITENAQQYYQGTQGFRGAPGVANIQEFFTVFNYHLIIHFKNSSNHSII